MFFHLLKFRGRRFEAGFERNKGCLVRLYRGAFAGTLFSSGLTFPEEEEQNVE